MTLEHFDELVDDTDSTVPDQHWDDHKRCWAGSVPGPQVSSGQNLQNAGVEPVLEREVLVSLDH